MRLVAVLTALVCAGPALAGEPAKVDFNRDVRPILFDKCVACHGPDETARKAGLRLDTRGGALEGEAFVPGKPLESAMVERVLSKDQGTVMPPPRTGKPVSPAEAEVLKKWIAQGAEYAGHWSYTRPTRPDLPPVTNAAWPRNPVDSFVLAKLESLKLAPQPEADRATR